jgi:hypothetical protein
MPEWDRAMLRYYLAFMHGDLAATYRTAAEVVVLAILDSLPPPEHGRSYADWDPDFFRARVEAILGNPSVAVQHLRAANRRGVSYEEVHGIARADFESIWDYPPFQRLTAGHSCENL